METPLGGSPAHNGVGLESEIKRVRHLLQVGRTLTGALDRRIILDRVLEAAREITGARCAALGVVNEQCADLVHPGSDGFPFGHSAMRSFLAAPVLIGDDVWGSLYVAEKADGQFSEPDEEAVVILAEWAGVAIENARLYETSELRREEAENACRGLEATRDVVVAIGADVTVKHVLDLIAKRGRALVNARGFVIMLREGKDLVVHASAGEVRQDAGGVRFAISGSMPGEAQQRGACVWSDEMAARITIADVGIAAARTVLLAPMVHRGELIGTLAAFDRGRAGETFGEDDEKVLRTFAASAATAVSIAQSVQAERLRSSLAAVDTERRRWARELHDETLQSLAALRVLLSAVLRLDDLPQAQRGVREAIGQIEVEIESLRSIITELRPAALDELGLAAAIESLLDRHREQSAFELEAEVLLSPAERGRRLALDLETAIYRLVQEALNNVRKHAGAQRVRVAVCERGGRLLIEVEDDGTGFDTNASSEGFGLAGMHERVHLAGGTLSVASGEGGTLLVASLPGGHSRHPDQA